MHCSTAGPTPNTTKILRFWAWVLRALKLRKGSCYSSLGDSRFCYQCLVTNYRHSRDPESQRSKGHLATQQGSRIKPRRTPFSDNKKKIPQLSRGHSVTFPAY